jgi:uroporphyrinogen decarboxylase
MAILDDPQWVKDMFKTNAELVINVAEEMMAKGFEFDGAFLYDDNGYRNATLFSTAAYKELLFPYHKMLFDSFRDKGLPTILHTCGCVNAFVPHYIEAGLTCLQPLEVKAGMDLIELKKKYGKQLAFMGGIDVRCMASDDPSEIEEEIRTKIPLAKKEGGYIYHSDHSVPDNVSFPKYKRTMELVMEYGRY